VYGQDAKSLSVYTSNVGAWSGSTAAAWHTWMLSSGNSQVATSAYLPTWSNEWSD
jgi:hypothetical protein